MRSPAALALSLVAGPRLYTAGRPRRHVIRLRCRSMTTTSRRRFLQSGALAAAGARLSAGDQSPGTADRTGVQPPDDVRSVKALVFDTFGTVVDWRSSVAAEVQALARHKGFTVDAER